MRKAAIALAGMLALILVWYTWRVPEIAVVPKTTPSARQAIESEAKSKSESESVSESESTTSNARARLSRSLDASLLSLQADGSTEESSAATLVHSESPILITKELPSYLEFYAQRVPGSKCMNPFDLLGEMQELDRNEAWAARTEQNLKDLLAPHPLGFPVTITCGGGICQISDLGLIEKIREREVEYHRYWEELRQRLYHVEPIASELATFSVSYAQYPEDTSQSITAFILTTKARVITADSLDCPSLNVPKIK